MDMRRLQKEPKPQLSSGLRLCGKEGIVEKEEVLQEALAARGLLYRCAWRLFAAPMDAEALRALGDPTAAEAVALLTGDDVTLAQAYDRLVGAGATESPSVEVLAGEYTKLFVGPGKLPAPPWESVYRSDGDLLFQESTLKVRDAYREAGFQAKGYPREADDHLATELSFMVSLIDEAVVAVEAGDAVRAHAFLAAQRKFLDQHLNGWAPAFACRLAEHLPANAGAFYSSAASFAAQLCAQDVAVVGELLDVVA